MLTSVPKRRTWQLVILLLLTFVFVLPTAAQDTVDENLVMVVGAVEFTADRQITVGGYIIAPAGAFNPSILRTGDLVIIIGRLLPDGITVQAQSFEFFEQDEEDVEDADEADEEDVEDVEPVDEIDEEEAEDTEPVDEVDETDEADDTEEDTTCGNPNHPIGHQIAAQFEMSYAEVMAMHCAGNGFGNIVRALLLAQASEDGLTAEELLEQAQTQGWGRIMRESGVHPSQLAPGRALFRNPAANPEAGGPGQGRGNNPGRGQGGGQGGPGNGNGFGPGNNPGQGGGQGNNPGQGRGGGRGRP